MDFIFHLFNDVVLKLAAFTISSLLIFYRKSILLFMEKKFQKWYSEFIVSVAQKNTLPDMLRIGFLTAIVISCSVIVPFLNFDNNFKKVEKDFHMHKVISDSIYHRIKHDKLKFKTYTEESSDVKNIITGSSSRLSDSTRNIVQQSLHERDEIAKLNVIVVIMKGLLYIFNIGIYFYILFLAALFARSLGRNQMINEFEWKLTQAKALLTDKEIRDFEIRWSMMKTGMDYRSIISNLSNVLTHKIE